MADRSRPDLSVLQSHDAQTLRRHDGYWHGDDPTVQHPLCDTLHSQLLDIVVDVAMALRHCADQWRWASGALRSAYRKHVARLSGGTEDAQT